MKALKIALSWFDSYAAAALLPLSVLRARPALSSTTAVLVAGFAFDFFSAFSFLGAAADFERELLVLAAGFSATFFGVFSFLTVVLFDREVRVSRFSTLAGVCLRADLRAAVLATDALPAVALPTEALAGDFEELALTTDALVAVAFFTVDLATEALAGD